jgi:ComF family protein
LKIPSAEYIDPMFSELLQRVSSQVSGRVPSQCAVCHAWPSQPVCEACVSQFAQPKQRCHTCALPLAASMVEGVTQCGMCIRNPPPLDRCLAAVSYEYPWADLIVRYKFGAQTGWSDTFALLLRSAPWVEPALDDADIVIPMPLTPARLTERGFNQALELAKSLAPAKTRARLLLRIQDGPAQSLLPRDQRLRNVKAAFAVDPLLAGQIRDKRVVLVDDVMTSGASLHAAATALRAAGAAHITGIVMARTAPAE